MHEAQMHEKSCFITLTYNDNHVATSLDYKEFQKFLKRLRKAHGPVRFFMSGEYGEEFARPHFHACLFGVNFENDRLLFKRSNGGEYIYTSPSLERLWPYGFSSIGDVTYESAAYIARYVVKKISGDMAEKHYESFDIRTGEITAKVPEFGHMSLKPGIGMDWIRKYYDDVISMGAVVISGRKMKIPKYYKDYLAKIDKKALTDIEFLASMYAVRNEDNATEERLAVREKVEHARLNRKKRSLE